MVDPEDVDLIDVSKLIRPFLKLFVAVGAWNVPNTSDKRDSCMN